MDGFIASAYIDRAMPFNIEMFRIIRVYVQSLSLRVEDTWIAQEQFREMLLRYGYTPELLAFIEAKAKADAHWRERAQKQLSADRKYFDDPAWDAAAEDILSSPPCSGKPSNASAHYNQSSAPQLPTNAARKSA